jgi:lysine-N-methylase
MQGFVCLGGECDDTCCIGWSLSMSRKDHKRLTLIIGREEAESVTVRRPAAARPTDDWAPGYAEFRTHGDRRCHYLDPAGLCSLQSERGASALTNVCDQYPRFNYQFDKTVEQVGTLACPEVARRCLLASDAPTFVPFEPDHAILDRPPLRLRDSKNGYRRYFELVRSHLLTTLTNRELAIGDRLAALLMQTERLASILQRGKLPNEARLMQALEHISSPDVMREVPRLMGDVPARGRSTLVVVSFVLGMLEKAGTRMANLVGDVRERYAVEAAPDFLSEIEFDRIIGAYELNRSAILERHAQRVDTYFTNHAVNYVLCMPFFDQFALVTYVQELVLRVAMLHLLFFSHPRVLELADSAKSPDTLSQLDDAAVSIFQPFAREVEHRPGVGQKLNDLLVQASARSPKDFLCLTRV